jgi:hypothetical protein
VIPILLIAEGYSLQQTLSPHNAGGGILDGIYNSQEIFFLFIFSIPLQHLLNQLNFMEAHISCFPSSSGSTNSSVLKFSSDSNIAKHFPRQKACNFR